MSSNPTGDDVERCGWCTSDPDYVRYHDEEWGVPLRDSRALFRLLQLEGMQAGLSWLTILRRRDTLDAGWRGFEPERVARMGEADRARLLADPGVIRNRAKVDATIGNARAWLALAEGPDGENAFTDLLWSCTNGRTLVHRRRSLQDVPAATPESQDMSRRLKKAGFRFVGPTICYAFMQASGMVNDHLVSCFRHAPCAALAGDR